jgi:SdrD B-like protein
MSPRLRVSAADGRWTTLLNRRLVVVASALALLSALLPTAVIPAGALSARPSQAAPAALTAPTKTIKLAVVERDAQGKLTATNVAAYKWLISVDDTGNPRDTATNCFPASNGAYPTGCDWPSVHNFTGGAGGLENLVTTGDETELNDDGANLILPDGRYLISVMADGYKIDGEWFTVPLESPGLVTVGLNPDPLPLGTLKIQVFADTSPNGQYDPGTEHGLAGFRAHIADVLAEVTTDWFGNPLCARYDGPPAGGNYIPGTGGSCVSDTDGVVTIPNLGSNRYSATVVPPTGQTWIQTSTLEGSHDWDTWVWEGYQGYDAELIVNGGNVPVAQFGFVQPTTFASPGSGHIKGRVISTKSYLPPAGGNTNEGPVKRPWIAVADLRLTDDQLVYAGRGNLDGTFDITGVPNSTYAVTMWDQDQNLLLAQTNVVVAGGSVADIGDFALPHWFSEIHGTVFADDNSNGVKDLGERGVPGLTVVLKSRDNSIVDAGSAVATTDINGKYSLAQVYPYGYWTVEEVYDDRYYTTGVTYQADNQPSATTVLGAGVDVSVLNQDGLNSRIDWGVRPYDAGTNGGIVGEVVYNLTRNELDPRLAAAEDYEPGIPNVPVNLWLPVACGTDAGVACDPAGKYELGADGAYKKGKLLNRYITEKFQRPTNCQARNAAGAPITYPFMPAATGGHECIESPLMGNQIRTGPDQEAGDFTLVNGNYGFADGCFATGFDVAAGGCVGGGDPETLTVRDYLVEVDMPMDQLGRHPAFNLNREEDINVFGGDQFAPAVPPPPCVGPLHVVDVAGIGADGPNATVNPSFVDAGGSPYEGQERPLCNMLLVPVSNQKSIAPGFYYFADVPLPGRLYGAVVEDLALGTDPNEFYYGEKAGIPNAPIGLYDYSGRLVKTLQSDPNGFFEVLLPSTRSFNCPLPAGPCPNVYRLVGNDPGAPGAPNPNYLPQYRTLESDWQMWPGLTLLADVALWQASAVIELPGTQTSHPPSCTLEVDGLGNPLRPQLFAVSVPYVHGTGDFAIDGQGFGTAGAVDLDGIVLPTSNWTDRHIDVSVPTGTHVGPHQLTIRRADNGLSTINALTFHVLGSGYDPTIYEVGPSKAYHRIQDALEAAASDPTTLVVIYPNAPGAFTPLGDYHESIVIHSPVKLQGVGPGGTRKDGSYVLGAIVNGQGFANTNFAAWRVLVEGLKAVPGTSVWAGNKNIYEGQVVYVLAGATNFGSDYRASIDGLTIRGGDEFGYPSTQPFYPVQGGGIFANAYASHLQITNNVIGANGGSYGGAIRVGTPYVGNNHNDDVRIAHNRILGNGGTNLAGAIGLFAGTNGYEVDHNDICGNFSAEYGGGISHFGLSSLSGPLASIHDNRIWFNGSYDEGAGITIAGELTSGATLSPGSGPVDVYDNVVQANLANDDGGGLRFLMAGNFPINVFNNFIVNNVSAHEGGGVALDDATNVRFYNNTVVRNLTTATAEDSDGSAMPAGLSDSGNSALLQATLPPGHADFGDPLLFNNIFWDNRAGSYDSSSNGLTGLGLPGDGSPINRQDMGVVGPGRLSPTNSVLQTTTDTNLDPSNHVGADPKLKSTYDLQVEALGWRAGGGPNQFVFVHLVTNDAPPGVIGDYHLLDATAPALNAGALVKAGQFAPSTDIDGDARLDAAAGNIDIGADEIDGVGPIVTILAVTPDPSAGAVSGTISGSASDVSTGNSTVVAAEWFEGADPGPGAGHAMAATDGAFDSPSEAISTTLTMAGFVLGSHALHVRALDAVGNWGAIADVSFGVSLPPGPGDLVGPVTTAAAIRPTSATTIVITANTTDAATGASTISRAEWFEGVDPGLGNGHAVTAGDGSFDGTAESLSATVNVSAWAGRPHILRIRAMDASGNWGRAIPAAVVIKPTLRGVANPYVLDDFSTGNLSAWSRIAGGSNLLLRTAAGVDGSPGLSLGLPRRTTSFVQDDSPLAATQYHARFVFNPHFAITGSTRQILFQGRAASGSQLFQIEYRHWSRGSYDVRIVLRRSTGLVSGPWVRIGNRAAVLELAWSAGRSGALRLYVNGGLKSTLRGNTSRFRLEQVRLGLLNAMASSSGREYIDGFVSSRTTFIGS